MASSSPSPSPDVSNDRPESPAPRRQLGRVCVYCASSTGSNEAIVEGATNFASVMAAENIELVYGEGAVGIMGLLADTMMAAGGRVTGIIPTGLMPREVAHRDITRLIEVNTMHDRKAAMIRLADAFVALPGGFGTVEELAEVLTWAQLNVHDKPIGLLNVDGYFDHLLQFFDRGVDDGLLKASNRSLIISDTDPTDLLEALRRHEPSDELKWASL